MDTSTNGNSGDQVDGTSFTALANSTVYLYAVGDSGYVLSHWIVDGQNAGDGKYPEIYVDGPHTVKAVFTSAPVYILPETGKDWPMYMHDPAHSSQINSTGPMNGQLLWRYPLDESGVRSAPTVVNNIVYVATRYGCVYAINATTDTPLWVFESEGKNMFMSSPVVANGLVYIGGYSGRFYALNATTDNPNGEVVWYYDTENYIASTATVANGVVYFGTDNDESTEYFYALNATTTNTEGQLLWRYDNAQTLISSPAYENGVVYFAGANGIIYAMNATTTNVNGEVLWTASIEATIVSSPIVSNGVLYVCLDEGEIIALNATNSDLSAKDRIIWLYSTEGDALSSSPALANGVLYVATDSGHILALNATAPDNQELSEEQPFYIGELLWSFATEDVFRSSSLAVSNGILYAVTYRGVVFALNTTAAESEAEQIIWAQPAGDRFYAGPAVSNGVIYLGSYRGILFAVADNTKVVFEASGLDGETEWSVTLNGITQTSTSDNIIYYICPTGNYTYTITPPEGYTAANLTGTIQVTGEDTETGTEIAFEIPTSSFNITINTAVGGTTSPQGIQTYNDADFANVTATPAAGYQFSYWLLDGENIGNQNPLALAINATHTLTPVFTLIHQPTHYYQITVVSAHGNPTDTANVEAGASFTASSYKPRKH